MDPSRYWITRTTDTTIMPSGSKWHLDMFAPLMKPLDWKLTSEWLRKMAMVTVLPLNSFAVTVNWTLWPKGQGVTMLTQRHERWRSKDYHVLPVGYPPFLFKAAPYTYIIIYLYMCMCTCIYIYIHVCIYIYMYMYMYLYHVHTYIYIHNQY